MQESFPDPAFSSLWWMPGGGGGSCRATRQRRGCVLEEPPCWIPQRLRAFTFSPAVREGSRCSILAAAYVLFAPFGFILTFFFK